MLTVEERQELVEKFEAGMRLAKLAEGRLSGSIDVVLACVIARESVAREFYTELNRCTDWGQA